MDVCSDCLEVVCGGCTTLMSCKFCGAGLCEDCAVCCGRCGIVLCKRDAKFAVECDTCKLSYCLVCLAQGTGNKGGGGVKACVRCHARPSKRVEQLVHLRLKSIYKAFKSTAGFTDNPMKALKRPPGREDPFEGPLNLGNAKNDSNSSSNHSNVNNNSSNSNNPSSSSSGSKCFDDMMNADRMDAGMSGGGKCPHSNSHKSSGSGPGRNSPSQQHHHHSSSSNSHNSTSGGGSGSPYSSNKSKQIAHREKLANEAAAALLAELDAEDNMAKKKKNKKKKNKSSSSQNNAHQQSNQNNQQQQNIQNQDSSSSSNNNNQSNISSSKAGGGGKDHSFTTVAAAANSSSSTASKSKSLASSSSSPSNKNLKNGAATSTTTHNNDEASSDEDSIDGFLLPNDAKIKKKKAETGHEEQLLKCINNGDAAGIERILEETRGVPGKAQLRKNAKKALKKLNTPPKGSTSSNANTSTASNNHNSNNNNSNHTNSSSSNNHQISSIHDQLASLLPKNSNLLKWLSLSSNNSNTHTNTNNADYSNNNNTTPNNIAKCRLKLHPLVVGWVIGRKGAKIKEVMERSGTKVWIDQVTTTVPNATDGMEEYRVVYITGNISGIELAVGFVVELVVNSPTNLMDPAERAALRAAAQANAAAQAAQQQSIIPPNPPTTNIHIARETTTSTISSSGGGDDRMGCHNNHKSSSSNAPMIAMSHAHHANLASHHPQRPSNSSGDHHPKEYDNTSITTNTVTTHNSNLNSNINNNNVVIHKLTCPPQFVPLLIGKRGWTIQHIQEVSGARVDIDQTANLTASSEAAANNDFKIVVIKGQAKEVETATNMVQDVLNYPYANLQYSNILSNNADDAAAGTDANVNANDNTAVNLEHALLVQEDEDHEDDEDTEDAIHCPAFETNLAFDDVSDVTGASNLANSNTIDTATATASVDLSAAPQNANAHSNNAHLGTVSPLASLNEMHYSQAQTQTQAQTQAQQPKHHNTAAVGGANLYAPMNANAGNWGGYGLWGNSNNSSSVVNNAHHNQQQQLHQTQQDPLFQTIIGANAAAALDINGSVSVPGSNVNVNAMNMNSVHVDNLFAPSSMNAMNNPVNVNMNNIMNHVNVNSHMNNVHHSAAAAMNPSNNWNLWGAAPPQQHQHLQHAYSGNMNVQPSVSAGAGGSGGNVNMDELTAFLQTLNLSKYAPILQENEVDLAVLPLMKEVDLAELGIPKGPRLKILRASSSGSAGQV